MSSSSPIQEDADAAILPSENAEEEEEMKPPPQKKRRYYVKKGRPYLKVPTYESDEDVPWRRGDRLTDPQRDRRLQAVRKYLRVKVCMGNADEALQLAENLVPSLRRTFAHSSSGGDIDGGLKRLVEERIRDDETRICAGAENALVQLEHLFVTKIDGANNEESCDDLLKEVRELWGRIKKRALMRKKQLKSEASLKAAAADARAVAESNPWHADLSEKNALVWERSIAHRATYRPTSARDIAKLKARVLSVQLELKRKEEELSMHGSSDAVGQEANKNNEDDPDMDFSRLLLAKKTKKKVTPFGGIGVKKLAKLMAAGITSGRELIEVWNNRDSSLKGRERIQKVYDFLAGNAAKRRNIVQVWVRKLEEEFEARKKDADLSEVQTDVDALETVVRKSLDPLPGNVSKATMEATSVPGADNALQQTARKKRHRELPSRNRASASAPSEDPDSAVSAASTEDIQTPLKTLATASTSKSQLFTAKTRPALSPAESTKSSSKKSDPPSTVGGTPAPSAPKSKFPTPKPIEDADLALPPGITWRTICRRCGRQKWEHMQKNFGTKCNLDGCGKCGAREEFHSFHKSPMGFFCRLNTLQGASTYLCKRYKESLELLSNEFKRKSSLCKT